MIIGDNTYIDALLKNGVSLGRNVTIGRNIEIVCTSVIRNLGEGIKIGDNVAIGSGSRIAVQGG